MAERPRYLDRQPAGGFPAERVWLEKAYFVKDDVLPRDHRPHKCWHAHAATAQYRQFQHVPPIPDRARTPAAPSLATASDPAVLPAATASTRLAPLTRVPIMAPANASPGPRTVLDHDVLEPLCHLGGTAVVHGYGTG